MFETVRTSKIVPPFKWHLNKEHFLGKEHWLRYKVMKELIEKNQLQNLYGIKTVDARYEYYFQAFNHRTFVVGTDDSGKYFTQFLNITASSILNYTERDSFRHHVFGFEYHWWEKEKIWENINPLVRLQGDLIVGFFNIERYTEYEIKNNEYFVKYVREKALEYGDTETYLAFSNAIPPGMKIFGELNIKKYFNKEKLKKYIDEVLSKKVEYKVYWGTGLHKHKLEFKGFRLTHNRFLVQPPVLKIVHKEHGTTEFEIVYPVVMAL